MMIRKVAVAITFACATLSFAPEQANATPLGTAAAQAPVADSMMLKSYHYGYRRYHRPRYYGYRRYYRPRYRYYGGY